MSAKRFIQGISSKEIRVFIRIVSDEMMQLKDVLTIFKVDNTRRSKLLQKNIVISFVLTGISLLLEMLRFSARLSTAKRVVLEAVSFMFLASTRRP